MNDKKNAIKRLQTASRVIKYNNLDLKEVNIGSPQEYLKLYHYLLLDYNVLIAAEIVNKQNMELSLKNDMVFMTSVYKLCRDMLNYVPKLTKDQFFSTGFAQAKALMAVDIIELLQEKAKSLQAHHGPSATSAISSSASIHQVLSSKHTPAEASLTSIQRSASLKVSKSFPKPSRVTSVVSNMFEKEGSDIKAEVRKPPIASSFSSLCKNPSKPASPDIRQSDDAQVDEEQFQNLFLTFTSKMTDLSSKLNGLLNRVDCLESNIPPLTQNHNINHPELNDTVMPTKETKSADTLMIEKIADDVTKLNRHFENLSNRMTLLETEVILLRQARNDGNNQDDSNSSATFETPFNSFLNISHTDKIATNPKRSLNINERLLSMEDKFDDLTINSADSTPKIGHDLKATQAPIARAQNLVNMASQISQMLSSGSKAF